MDWVGDIPGSVGPWKGGCHRRIHIADRATASVVDGKRIRSGGAVINCIDLQGGRIGAGYGDAVELPLVIQRRSSADIGRQAGSTARLKARVWVYHDDIGSYAWGAGGRAGIFHPQAARIVAG